MFAGFSNLRIDADGVSFSGMIAGSGPPVLLLHGYPQTHLAWRFIAPRLAQSFTVVVPDLPGYGNSRTQTDQPRWTKRRVADDVSGKQVRGGHLLPEVSPEEVLAELVPFLSRRRVRVDAEFLPAAIDSRE